MLKSCLFTLRGSRDEVSVALAVSVVRQRCATGHVSFTLSFWTGVPLSLLSLTLLIDVSLSPLASVELWIDMSWILPEFCIYASLLSSCAWMSGLTCGRHCDWGRRHPTDRSPGVRRFWGAVGERTPLCVMRYHPFAPVPLCSRCSMSLAAPSLFPLSSPLPPRALPRNWFLASLSSTSLMMDGSFATPSPGPRSWRETFGEGERS